MSKYFVVTDAGTGIITAGKIQVGAPKLEGAVEVGPDDLVGMFMLWLSQMEPAPAALSAGGTEIDPELFDGMGQTSANKLKLHGVTSVEELAITNFGTIRGAGIGHINKEIADRWIETAQRLLS